MDERQTRRTERESPLKHTALVMKEHLSVTNKEAFTLNQSSNKGLLLSACTINAVSPASFIKHFLVIKCGCLSVVFVKHLSIQ